ncbi:FlgO family outer membrane protein [Arcobacter vandammei]|uniref:FlgO family outer membrane protein n=1 Tax=Arcobacter vandammei TaxID=2782243 RepID=UPI0018DF5440|nr:FlgO family outer membrane protein [Arcobacter vandammei]
MNKPYLKVVKQIFVLLLLSLSFNSCAYKYPLNGSNNFHALISAMVDESSQKIKRHVGSGEVVLVSDFVNLDKLKNKSQLGFLLSSMLKDKLSSLNIIVKEIELGKEFEIGKTGFNLLTREQNKILSNKVQSRYAAVGTYSITSKTLNVFIRLIDVNTGNILSSSYGRTNIDDEILGLEGNLERKTTPSTRPHLVL